MKAFESTRSTVKMLQKSFVVLVGYSRRKRARSVIPRALLLLFVVAASLFASRNSGSEFKIISTNLSQSFHSLMIS